MLMRKYAKKIILLFTILSLGISGMIMGQTSNGPEFKYKAENNRIHLDTMYLDNLEDPVKLEIKFENDGDAPLLVKKVSGCCGTNVKEWTRKPLQPGEEGVIHIEFRVPPRPHKISRTITAVSNDNSGKEKLSIQGMVAKRDDDSLQLGGN